MSETQPHPFSPLAEAEIPITLAVAHGPTDPIASMIELPIADAATSVGGSANARSLRVVDAGGESSSLRDGAGGPLAPEGLAPSLMH